MVKTKHCPNCEATEQKLHDFRQEVSNAVVCYFSGVELDTRLHRFIIPKPKPDPLVEVLLDMELSHDQEQGQHDARYLRAKLEARGFEIRRKSDDR
jgi:hypothetical protein